MSPQHCTDITAQCTVEKTIYAYYPSLPANALFCGAFGLLLAVQLFQGLKWKSWTFMIALALGCLGEAVGYAGRILMHGNPYSQVGFNMQICCLIIAPAFFSAGLYLTLKHIVLTLGPQYSRLRAKYYTWLFISCDLLSLILQGAGGGIAATAKDDDTKMQKLGNNLMMAGIVFQVITLLVFGVLAASYAWTVFRNRTHFSQSTIVLLSNSRFQLFLTSLAVTFTAIFTRCVYRIAEMAGGWRNPIMQNEREFIVLDGVMCLVATLCLTIFHPGFCFPQMQMKNKNSTGEQFTESKKFSDVESTS